MSQQKYTIDQTRAIEFFPTDSQKKHLVIEAGAGSGKTTILKERIQFLLTKKNFLPEDIIVLTFANNATSELKHRIENLQNLSETVRFIHVSTIDSFFASLVESLYPIWWDAHTSFTSKMPSQLSLLDETRAMVELENILVRDMHKFSEENLREIADFILAGGFENGRNSFARSPFQALLSLMIQDVFLSASVEDIRISARHVHPATQKLIAHCHASARVAYAARIQAGTFTYQDRTVFLKENLGLSCPLFFKELIVDEYQDTNHIQHSILSKLVELNHAQMTVVGDPKQSIYAFRGAHVDVFQSLTQHDHWNLISLDMNFRSSERLLNEVNTLSYLSFDWQTPELMDSFKTSFFYKEALKKSISHKALRAGNTGGSVSAENLNAQHKTSHPSVILFEYDAQNEKNPKKGAFNTNNLNSLAQYLKEQVNANVFEWKDAAILCEKNSQIAKIRDIFSKWDIPVSSDREHKTSQLEEFANTVAFSLFNVLSADTIELNLDLFCVLTSPLTELSFHEVIGYFLDQTHAQTQMQPVLNIITEKREIFRHNFFVAWQTCRWDLAKLCVDHIANGDRHPNANVNSLIFCMQMDDFAKKLFDIPQMQTVDSIKKILNKSWLDPKKANSLDANENTLSLKTVHGAKGLEWDVVCFYPSSSPRDSAESFFMANSWPYLDINWLSEDVKILSHLEKCENEQFTEIDCDIDPEKEKKIWFSDLRKNLEKNFERKRIFYTAFTRPRKKLIFVHPERPNANSALKLDKKFDNSNYQKQFEQDIYLKYAHLTQEKRTDAEHIKFMSSRDLIAGPNESARPGDSRDLAPSSREFTAGSSILSPAIISSSSMTTNTNLNSEIVSSPLSIIHIKQKKRKAAHKGIVFHAKQENKFFSDHSVSHLIHTHALKTWTEFEIWNQKEVNDLINKHNLERKVIDLLALFCRNEFASLMPEFSKHLKFANPDVFRILTTENDLHNTSSISNFVFLILDFKTGILTHKYIHQLEKYEMLVTKLCASGWFKKIIPEMTAPYIVTALH